MEAEKGQSGEGKQRSAETRHHQFCFATGLILGLTGVAKLWSAVGDVRLLLLADPITGLPVKYMMLIVAVAELAIAAVCLFSKARGLATMLVMWVTTDFLVERPATGSWE
jgi:hypothetical protein